MPIYYFDIEDTTGVHPDPTGIELPTMDAAVHEARRTLADMSRELLSRGAEPDQSLKIVIRDHQEGPIMIAMSITTRWEPGDD